MASVTPVAGEMGFAPGLSGDPTQPTTVPRNPMPAQAADACVQRIASVRILRGSAEWRGIAMRLANSGRDEERFELALTAGDGRSITIAVVNQDDVVALWRDCGQATGMPLLLETPDGTVSEPFPQIGRLSLGPVRIRRRHAFLNDRRPRFLVRRKTGRLDERPVMIRGEQLTD